MDREQDTCDQKRRRHEQESQPSDAMHRGGRSRACVAQVGVHYDSAAGREILTRDLERRDDPAPGRIDIETQEKVLDHAGAIWKCEVVVEAIVTPRLHDDVR